MLFRSPEHWDAKRDVPVLRRWNPPVVKFMWPNGLPPTAALQAVIDQGTPLIIIREWAMSEEKTVNSRDEARERGINHADRSKAMMDEIIAQHGNVDVRRFAFEGWNEPWQIRAEWVNEYDVSRLMRLRQHGLRGVGSDYGVGWGADYGFKDSAENFEPFEGTHQEIVRGGHLLGRHEYWSFAGPYQMHDDGHGRQMGGWLWEAGRYLQCPWDDVQIVITECGIDTGVVPGQPNEGWYKLPGRAEDKAQTYAEQLFWFDRQLALDKRVVGACIFTYDFN